MGTIQREARAITWTPHALPRPPVFASHPRAGRRSLDRRQFAVRPRRPRVSGVLQQHREGMLGGPRCKSSRGPTVTLECRGFVSRRTQACFPAEGHQPQQPGGEVRDARRPGRAVARPPRGPRQRHCREMAEVAARVREQRSLARDTPAGELRIPRLPERRLGLFREPLLRVQQVQVLSAGFEFDSAGEGAQGRQERAL